MLYEMLAGKQPFTGDSPMQIAMQHAKKQMPLASLTNPFVGQAVDDVIQWSTAKDPNDRPKDARAFLDALRKASMRRVSDASYAPAALDDEEEIVSAPEPADDDATSILEAAFEDVGDGEVTTPITTVVKPEPIEKPKFTLPAMPQLPTIKIPRIALPNKGSTKAAVDFEQDPQSPRRRRRSGALILAVLIAIAGVGGGGYWWFNAGPGSMAQAIDVLGMAEADATAALTNAHFTVLDPATEQYDDTVVAGAVIGTDPVLSGSMKKGTEVRLIVSLGPEPVDLPTYSNITAESYSSQLAKLKIAITKTDEQFSADITAGLVISVLSESGTVIPEGTTLHHGDSVVVVKSLGPLPVVAGLTAAEATTMLQDSGLVVALSDVREFNDTVADGLVSSMTVPDGIVRPGDKVTLVLSKGPELVEVPSVLGLTIKRANAELVAAGFKVIIITDIPRDFWGDSFAKAKRTDPTAGTKIPKGTTVKIYGIF
jgi:serine/threonine-protein kinase